MDHFHVHVLLHHDRAQSDRDLNDHRHNASDHHEDGMIHIHGYVPANHIGLGDCYKTHPQSHAHQSMTIQH